MTERDRTRSRELQREHATADDGLGWFDALYREAGGDPSLVPWADLRPRPELTGWYQKTGADWTGQRCLVIGCGLGDDAEFAREKGAIVTAFDLSETAIAWCRRRFLESSVNYVVANLLKLPSAWSQAFDVVIEINTLQAIEDHVRPRAFRAIAETVARGGTAVVICRGREADDAVEGPPWPLTRDEVNGFERHGLRLQSFEEMLDQDDPPVRRFVSVWRRV